MNVLMTIVGIASVTLLVTLVAAVSDSFAGTAERLSHIVGIIMLVITGLFILAAL